MAECIIDLQKLGTEIRTNTVLYACSDFIIYKDKSQLYYDNCAGENISTIKCPFNTQGSEHCESGEDIVFMVSGKQLIVKHGDNLFHQQNKTEGQDAVSN